MNAPLPPGPPLRRILALDGGGIRGTYSAAFLTEIESATGKAIRDHFDLLVGTSTGGIIALGLGMGLLATEILDFYERHGPAIFPTARTATGVRRVRHLFRPKHRQEALRRVLHQVFGERLLGESMNRLVLVSYDGFRGDIHLLKTRHSRRFGRDHLRLAVDVALATSAAPTFFPPSHAGGFSEIDGGVWANCPALVGTVEAKAVLGWPLSSLRILSVGTTRPAFHVSHSSRRSGILAWLTRHDLTTLLMEAQVSGALAQARLLVGKDNLLRVDDTVAPKRFALDNAKMIQELKGMGLQAARHAQPEVERLFLTEPAEPFQPYATEDSDQPDPARRASEAGGED